MSDVVVSTRCHMLDPMLASGPSTLDTSSACGRSSFTARPQVKTKNDTQPRHSLLRAQKSRLA